MSSAASIPVVILVRVSTLAQEVDRQVIELEAVAAGKGWTVVEVVREAGVSGDAVSADRAGLGRALELAAAGAVRKVLVHEVSRVARRNSVAHDFIERLSELGVSLYWHAQGLETLLANGKRNPAAALVFSLLAEMARSERETLIERTRSGLEAARRRGAVLGRPAGSVEDPAVFLAKHGDVVGLLRAGKSLRDVAARTGKSQGTVVKVKRALAEAHSG